MTALREAVVVHKFERPNVPDLQARRLGMVDVRWMHKWAVVGAAIRVTATGRVIAFPIFAAIGDLVRSAPGSATNDRSAPTSGSRIIDAHPDLDGAFP